VPCTRCCGDRGWDVPIVAVRHGPDAAMLIGYPDQPRLRDDLRHRRAVWRAPAER
jgi:hypothetical protein